MLMAETNMSRMQQKMSGMTGMSGMSGMSGMNMSSSISWNTKCVTFLFDTFHAKNLTHFSLGCIIIFTISILNQLISLDSFKNLITGINPNKPQPPPQLPSHKTTSRNFHYNSQQHTQQKQHTTVPSQNSPQISLQNKIRMVLYYSFAALVNLLLMLIAMSMNGYIILSIVLGTGIGKTINIRNIQKMNRNKIQNKYAGDNQKIWSQNQDCCNL